MFKRSGEYIPNSFSQIFDEIADCLYIPTDRHRDDLYGNLRLGKGLVEIVFDSSSEEMGLNDVYLKAVYEHSSHHRLFLPVETNTVGAVAVSFECANKPVIRTLTERGSWGTTQIIEQHIG